MMCSRLPYSRASQAPGRSSPSRPGTASRYPRPIRRSSNRKRVKSAAAARAFRHAPSCGAPTDVRRAAEYGNSRAGASDSAPCRLPRAETAVSEFRIRSLTGQTRLVPTPFPRTPLEYLEILSLLPSADTY